MSLADVLQALAVPSVPRGSPSEGTEKTVVNQSGSLGSPGSPAKTIKAEPEPEPAPEETESVTSWGWRLYFTDREPSDVYIIPEVTHAEALAAYPGVVKAEPIPEPPRPTEILEAGRTVGNVRVGIDLDTSEASYREAGMIRCMECAHYWDDRCSVDGARIDGGRWRRCKDYL